MNLLDAYVEEVLSEPRFNDKYADQGRTWWEVDVTYTCWSDKVESRTLTFRTEEEAKEVTAGYKFLT